MVVMENLLNNVVLPQEVNFIKSCGNHFLYLKFLQILSKVFEYLPLQDLLKISVVSKHWFEASLYPTFMKRRKWFIVNDLINQTNPATSYRYLLGFNNMLINNISISSSEKVFYDTEFWNYFKASEHLEITSSHVQQIFIIFKMLNNLKSLYIEIESMEQVEMTNQIEGLKKAEKLMLKTLQSNYLPIFLRLMPALVHISLTLENDLNESEKECLLEYLEAGRDRIRHLELTFNSLNSNTLDSIFQIEGMNLVTLSVRSQFKLNCRSYIDLGKFTDGNKLLNLRLPFYHSDIDLRFVCNTFQNLQRFYLGGCGYTNFSNIYNLRNLEVNFEVHQSTITQTALHYRPCM